MKKTLEVDVYTPFLNRVNARIKNKKQKSQHYQLIYRGVEMLIIVSALSLSSIENVHASVNTTTSDKSNNTQTTATQTNTTNTANTTNTDITQSEQMLYNSTQDKDKYLFVQSVHKATLKRVDNTNATATATANVNTSNGNSTASTGGQTSKLYTVTLHDVSPYVTAFTDRPAKKAKLVPIEQLLKLWQIEEKDSFKKKPPNAAINGIVVGSTTQDPVNIMVELTDSVYDKATKTLTYTIKPLNGNPYNIPDNVVMDHVNFFIDDVCLSCYWPH